MEKNKVRIVRLSAQKSDFSYWKTQSYAFRLQTLETIRQEYNQWKYGTEQGFQRVYRIVKQA